MVATDGVKTFVQYLYPEDEIQWGGGAQIGLEAGSEGNILNLTEVNYMHPAALSNDTTMVENTTNVGINGRWIFRADTLVQLQPGGTMYISLYMQ